MQISFRLIAMGPIPNKAVLVQAIDWQVEVTGHYLNQRWSDILILTFITRLHFVKPLLLNSSPPGQNGTYFADNIFKHIFMKEKSDMRYGESILEVHIWSLLL